MLYLLVVIKKYIMGSIVYFVLLFSFQINSDKLRTGVSILDLRGLEFYNIFNGTTIADAVGKILTTMLSRLLQSAILE